MIGSKLLKHEKLSTYLLEHRFFRSSGGKTLFIRKVGDNTTISQIYMDDIVFGSSLDALAFEITKKMKNKFEMSMIGKLTFFF